MCAHPERAEGRSPLRFLLLTARNFDQKYWTVHFTSTQYTFFGKKFEFLTHLNILLWWGENSSYRQSKPSPNYFRKWIIWTNSKIWQKYFGRFPEILSWETMRTCLNGYWMGNRRPTNTHILRSALRNSQNKKIFSTMQGTGEMVFRIWGTRKKQTCKLLCALCTERRFPWKQSRQVSMCGTTYTENLSLRILEGKRRTDASIHVLCVIFPYTIISTSASWRSRKYSLALCKPNPAVGNAMDGRRNETLSC